MRKNKRAEEKEEGEEMRKRNKKKRKNEGKQASMPMFYNYQYIIEYIKVLETWVAQVINYYSK